jgi:hypothetical protein
MSAMICILALLFFKKYFDGRLYQTSKVSVHLVIALILFFVSAVSVYPSSFSHKIKVSKYFLSVPDGTLHLIYWFKVEGVLEKDKDLINSLNEDGYRVRLAEKNEREMFYDLYRERDIRKEENTMVSHDGRGERLYPKRTIILQGR